MDTKHSAIATGSAWHFSSSWRRSLNHTHTHTRRVSVLHTLSHQTPTIHCFKQWISRGVTPKREIRSNDTTSTNSIRHGPHVLVHKSKCFEEIKRPLLGVTVSWLQHEVIVTTLKAPFFLATSAGGGGVHVCVSSGRHGRCWFF